MKSFEKSVAINCSVEELFNFHLDTNNLKHITPPDTKVELLTPNLDIKEGAVLKLKTTKHFISTIWEIQIQKLISPSLLIDVSLKSPFTYWEHSHIFEKREEGCLMRDVVNYTLPFGFIGNSFDFLIQKELKNMFEFRHNVTKTMLEEKS
ncbi:SRPBCC family protein [Sulfurospirillum arcachonense]|uniref:SRPBCC family protein n=1 Tax=Sulfurospirillum arcachonense TaxID=57666 RepID=UPI0004690ADC|nr:SRPBCC family protein [Sulfurospirillum arcachonense]